MLITATDINPAFNSTWIDNLEYETDTKDAEMYVRGKQYTFPRLSLRLFTSWANSSSPGQFYNKYIKAYRGKLRYRRLSARLRWFFRR